MSTAEPNAVNASPLKLVIEDDEGVKSVYPLMHQELTIGRDEANDIRLVQRTVSRQHARVTVHETEGLPEVVVYDLHSYMGVKLNGKRISDRAAFRVGDFIELGDYLLSLQPPDGEAPAQEQATPVEPLPPEAHAKLVAVSSNLAGQSYPLHLRELIIGREPHENDVVVNHRSVSRNHAKVVWRDHKFTIIDLRSANGLLVNGSPFRAANLVSGDVITLGHVKLRFVAPGDPYVFSPADIESVEVEQRSLLKPALLFILLLAATWSLSRLVSSLRSGETLIEQGAVGPSGGDQSNAEQGSSEQGDAGQSSAGQGNAEQGSAEQGSAGQGNAGQGDAGQGDAGQGGAGQGGAGQGDAGPSGGEASGGGALNGQPTTDDPVELLPPPSQDNAEPLEGGDADEGSRELKLNGERSPVEAQEAAAERDARGEVELKSKKTTTATARKKKKPSRAKPSRAKPQVQSNKQSSPSKGAKGAKARQKSKPSPSKVSKPTKEAQEP